MARRSLINKPELEAQIQQLENPHQHEEALDYCYNHLGLSLRETGDKLGVSHTTVLYQMVRHDLSRRDRLEAAKKAHQ